MRKIVCIAGGLLLAAAFFLAGKNFYEDNQAARSSKKALLKWETDQTEGAERAGFNTEMPVVKIDGADYIGVLEIPALELTLPVIRQLNSRLLKLSPCRYKGSVYTGDLILAAHNYKAHFGDLNRLKEGDSVYFTDAENNRFSYTVSRLEELDGTAVEEMQDGDWELTLFTCTVGGKARVTVRCEEK